MVSDPMRFPASSAGMYASPMTSEDLVVPADRAAEINLRFSHSSDSLKIRTRGWAADEEAKGEAVLRAFVSPTYAPIDDLYVFEALKSALGDRLQIGRESWRER